jgi:ParB family chromosome partitioning protein
MVDSGKIGMTPAVELSYLKPEEQSMLLTTIDYEQSTPSLSQAQRMKRQSQDGTLNEDSMLAIMCEQKKPCWDNITLKGKDLRRYFPNSSAPLQIETVIYRLLEKWAEGQKNAG